MFVAVPKICFSNIFQGAETYENQLKYGKEIFEELQNLQSTGYFFRGCHHEIHIVCCCDWKAGACIEGSSLLYKFIALNIHDNLLFCINECAGTV